MTHTRSCINFNDGLVKSPSIYVVLYSLLHDNIYQSARCYMYLTIDVRLWVSNYIQRKMMNTIPYARPNYI